MKELVILYEQGQIDTVLAYVRDKKGAEIIALNYWMERELQSRGVVVRPLTDYVPCWRDFSALHTAMEQTARQWHRLPGMSFFKHRGLSIGESAELMVSILLDALQGYLLFFERVFEVHPDISRLVVPHPTRGVTSGAGPFAPFQIQVVTDMGAFVAQKKGVPCVNIGTPPEGELEIFPKLPLLKKLALRLY